MATRLGICRNSNCPNGASGATVELYPGPGEYCPECGEKLEATTAAPPAPFGGMSALQALERFTADEPAVRARPRPKRPLIVSGAIVSAAIAAIVMLHPSAIGHPGEAVRICNTSMTARFGDELVRAYAAKSGTPNSQLALVQTGPCEVQLAATAGANNADTIGHDGIVAIVNPANPLMHLGDDVLRKIYRGEVTDWSQLGGPPGPIVAMLAADGSDEAAAVGTKLMHGTGFGSSVQRLPNSRDITRAVVRADNLRAIGLVPFSQSDPGKVLTLGTIAPSPLSIADSRYPLSLDVTVALEPAAHAQATAFAEYARSDDAQALVARSGLVPKKGI